MRSASSTGNAPRISFSEIQQHAKSASDCIPTTRMAAKTSSESAALTAGDSYIHAEKDKGPLSSRASTANGRRGVMPMHIHALDPTATNHDAKLLQRWGDWSGESIAAQHCESQRLGIICLDILAAWDRHRQTTSFLPPSGSRTHCQCCAQSNRGHLLSLLNADSCFQFRLQKKQKAG